MANVAGTHSERVAKTRELLTAKGRKAQQRFAFEGPTLFAEAVRSGAAIEELYVTRTVYDAEPLVREMESGGTPVFLIDERTAEKLSDVETPSGLIAVSPMRSAPLDHVLSAQLSLVLADINDPGNAGTLLRSAEAFGGQAVVFGAAGVEPYHPKVVRAAMGAIFRIPLAVATPERFGAAAHAAHVEVLGLDARGDDIRAAERSARTALVVGHERRGLGPWEAFCTRRVAIPMSGPAESLNAAVAGSIALYALSTPR